MRLKNVLIVVKDIEKSRKFYHDLFGIDLVLDNDGNMILTEGLVLQDEKIWKSFLGRDILPQNNACELYFEEQDIEVFVEKLERLYPSIEYPACPARPVQFRVWNRPECERCSRQRQMQSLGERGQKNHRRIFFFCRLAEQSKCP